MDTSGLNRDNSSSGNSGTSNEADASLKVLDLSRANVLNESQAILLSSLRDRLHDAAAHSQAHPLEGGPTFRQPGAGALRGYADRGMMGSCTKTTRASRWAPPACC